MLWDDPPHSCSVLTPTVSTDAGGGVVISFSTTQSGVPCSFNVASSSTREMFAQQGMTVDATVGFKTEALTTALARGMKLTDQNGVTYAIHGISSGFASGVPGGSIPALVYAHCERIV